MNLDTFERLVSRASILFLVAPIQAAAMILLTHQNRVFLGIAGILSLCLGAVLRFALHRFRANLQFGIRLVEGCFYVCIAGSFASLVNFCLTHKDIIASPAAVLIFAPAVPLIYIFLLVKKSIDSIKHQNLQAGNVIPS
jgi:hypothetical protein